MLRAKNSFFFSAVLLIGLGITLNLDTSDRSNYSDALVHESGRIPEPRFEIGWLRGALQLSGHTASAQHEQDLLDIAAASFPGRQVTTAFEPMGIVPDYWQDTTSQVLYALASTLTARASLSAERVAIRGVVVDNISSRNRFIALTNTLPKTISFTQDVIGIVEHVDATRMCDDAFAAFDAGRINFEENSTRFLSSAFARLDRVAAIADACRNSAITITGHTDASGNAAWNRELSLRRAQAVADHIAGLGIDRARLHANGAGSLAPIADNNTRYGRGLNRRIEIGFRSY